MERDINFLFLLLHIDDIDQPLQLFRVAIQLLMCSLLFLNYLTVMIQPPEKWI